jgi:hypothetical protein
MPNQEKVAATEDLVVLVDDACDLSFKIKVLTEKLDSYKRTFKKMSEDREVKTFLGTTGRKVVISTLSTSYVDTNEFVDTCNELKIAQEFFVPCIKVLTGKARSLLGTGIAEELITTTVNLYGKISFKGGVK